MSDSFCEPRENWPDRNPEVQEALSRKYSDDVIMLLPLKTGRIAVFNNARELCGIIPFAFDLMEDVKSAWYPPKPTKVELPLAVDLKDLGLL